MRIAHIITRMDWGGSPDIVRLLCEGLGQQGMDCVLFCGRTEYASGRTRTFLDKIGARLTIIEALQRQIHPFKDAAACRELAGLLRRGNFDIVHTHTAKAGALGRIAASLAGVRPVVHSPHGHNFYGYFNPWFSACIALAERVLAPLAEVLVVQTELEKKDYIRYAGVDHHRIRVIPQGIEPCCALEDSLALRRSLGIPSGNLVVGTVGRLEKIKGIDILVLAAARLVKDLKKVSFVVAGEGSQAPALRSLVSRNDLAPHFIFTGWRDDARQLMPAFDLLVLPSLNEAVGMVLLEAQSAGVPVVATRVGGIPEVVQEGKTAVLVPAADVPALSLAIGGLLGDPGRRAAMAAQARVWALERFGARQMVDAYAQLYRSLAGNRRAAR